MAKKNQKNRDRQAKIEQLRAEQARKERLRSLAIFGACVLVVVGLLSVAVVKYVQDKNAEDRLNNLALGKVGVPASQAGCDTVTTKKPTGTAQSGVDGNHVAIGTKMSYPTSPPAFGQHWPNYLQGAELRNFWTPKDRPELGRVVHSLEHGHTLIWYDDTVTAGSADYKALQAIADKYASSTTYVNIVPWLPADGNPFPAGKHVVLTHWAGSGKKQEGIWQYCGKASGAVIKSFVTKYPSSDSPEAGAP